MIYDIGLEMIMQLDFMQIFLFCNRNFDNNGVGSTGFSTSSKIVNIVLPFDLRTKCRSSPVRQ